MSSLRIFILDWGCDERSRRLEDVLARCERPRFDVRCRHLGCQGLDRDADRLAPEVSEFAPAVLVMAISDVAKVSEARRVVQAFIHHDCQHCPLLVAMGRAAPTVAESFGQTVCEVWSPTFRPREAVKRLTLLLKDVGSPSEETAEWLKDRLGLAHIIGESPALLGEIRKIPDAAQEEGNVLIRGETGTGKEVFAQAIHQHSQRRDGPFVALNSGGMHVDLFENELFGHVAGAYTGAHQDATGKVDRACGGTLFLDEVDTLPLDGQVKLLRLLQQRTYYRLGSHEERVANIRVIAATNSNLHEAISAGRFRADLYHRLNYIQFKLPPLRERQGDLDLLARHILKEFSRGSGKPECHLTAAAAQHLRAYTWPGNVRELQNALTQAARSSREGIINAVHLQDLVPVEAEESMNFREAREVFERAFAQRVMQANGGNVTRAAVAAGMTRQGFHNLLHRSSDRGALGRN